MTVSDQPFYFQATVKLLLIALIIAFLILAQNIMIPFTLAVFFTFLLLPVSRKLEHLPLRYNILLHDLQRWNLRYTDPSKTSTDPLTGDPVKQDKFMNILDEGLRHVILGIELTPVNRFVLRLGYNPQLRKEMKLDTKASTVGFSWGFGIRIKKISIDYARSTWHLNGSPNYFTISANLSDFMK